MYELATNSRVKCWADNIKLVYDFKEGKNKNAEGVETRVPGWGETETVEFIDPRWEKNRRNLLDLSEYWCWGRLFVDHRGEKT